jgi:GNAT superfamily N-acetyltransferase
MSAAARVTGGATFEAGGVTCVRHGDEVVIPFPDALPSQHVLDLDAARIGCWSAEPSPDLDEHLRGLGFEPGWRPHWMTAAAAAAEPYPRVSEPSEVPEYDGHGQALLALTRERPQSSFLFLAREDGRFAGHVWLHVAAGVGGLYDAFVVEDLRRRGLGSALVGSASSKAAALGIQTLTLNAEAEEFWAAAGFRSLGHGQTWWHHRC